MSLAPTLIGMTGAIYFAGALVLGLALPGPDAAVRADARSRRTRAALFFGSIIYLPLLWILMIADRL